MIQARLLEHIVDESQHLQPPASGWDCVLDLVPKHHRPDAIPMTGQQAREHCHKINKHRTFFNLRLQRPKID